MIMYLELTKENLDEHIRQSFQEQKDEEIQSIDEDEAIPLPHTKFMIDYFKKHHDQIPTFISSSQRE